MFEWTGPALLLLWPYSLDYQQEPHSAAGTLLYRGQPGQALWKITDMLRVSLHKDISWLLNSTRCLIFCNWLLLNFLWSWNSEWKWNAALLPYEYPLGCRMDITTILISKESCCRGLFSNPKVVRYEGPTKCYLCPHLCNSQGHYRLWDIPWGSYFHSS